MKSMLQAVTTEAMDIKRYGVTSKEVEEVELILNHKHKGPVLNKAMGDKLMANRYLPMVKIHMADLSRVTILPL